VQRPDMRLSISCKTQVREAGRHTLCWVP
jgi:hypothetical protein